MGIPNIHFAIAIRVRILSPVAILGRALIPSISLYLITPNNTATANPRAQKRFGPVSVVSIE